jgi:4-amino-4-deoxy-L-arabinose transferase-like glycosyltransferase
MTLLQCGSGREPFQNPRVVSSAAPRPSGRLGRPPAWIWLLLPMVASAALRGLWAPDEPRYAEVARELFQGGSWTVLRRCGEIYADKPPLFFWTAGLLGWMSGWSVPAMRLESLASIAVLPWLTARFAGRAWAEREARWAPLLLFGFLMVIELGGRLQIDPLLAALCTGAIVLFDEAREGERPAQGARGRLPARLGGSRQGAGRLGHEVRLTQQK